MEENARTFNSWGRHPQAKQGVIPIHWASEVDFECNQDKPLLPVGQGRSYGDSCLNDGGNVIATSGLSRFLGFDHDTGVLRCESGVTLADILAFFAPRGWFLPVVPGTKFVSVAGAIANDIHSKNHHGAGTFGCHVIRFCVLRSDGVQYLCSPDENEELFSATIGGLGLTGVILWADLKLKPIENEFIEVEEIQFHGVQEFIELSMESEKDFEYTVAWVDCMAAGDDVARGIFIRGNHAKGSPQSLPKIRRPIPLAVPFALPEFVLNRYIMRLFNVCFFNKQRTKVRKFVSHYDPFFFPLDSIHNWNLVYGKRGFFQYQFVISGPNAPKGIEEIIAEITRSDTPTFLTVLKTFGDKPSPGMMSFPKPGITFALDFPNEGAKTERLFETLDKIVEANQGRIYPAKDARMSPESFKNSFPRWEEFQGCIDPRLSSSFWRRVVASSE